MFYPQFLTRLDAYPSLRFTDSSPAQEWEEPLTTQQVRNALKIEYGNAVDEQQEDELKLMIAAARCVAEQYQNRDLVRKQYDMSLDYWPGWKIEMRDPLISVDLFTRTDSSGNPTTLVENIDFIVDKAKSTPILLPPSNSFWPGFTPARSSGILIRFTAGYKPDSQWWTLMTGTMVRRGMLKLIAHWVDQNLPFTREVGTIQEMPFTVSQMLSSGAAER